MVGRLSRIRVSSVTRTLPPRTSVGTLKSTRTSTRFPRTSRSRTVSFAIITPTLLLMLLLVIVLDWIHCLVFAQHIRTVRKFAKQPNKHLDDSRESFLSGNNLLLVGK